MIRRCLTAMLSGWSMLNARICDSSPSCKHRPSLSLNTNSQFTRPPHTHTNRLSPPLSFPLSLRPPCVPFPTRPPAPRPPPPPSPPYPFQDSQPFNNKCSISVSKSTWAWRHFRVRFAAAVRWLWFRRRAQAAQVTRRRRAQRRTGRIGFARPCDSDSAVAGVI